MKATDKLYEKAPPAVKKLRRQATSELRKIARKQWKEQQNERTRPRQH